MRRRGRVDDNHVAVVKALRAAGYVVLSLSEIGNNAPDLLVARGGQMWLVEVKRPRLKDHAPMNKRERDRLAKQDAWAKAWPAPVHRVYGPEDALAKLYAVDTEDI